MSIEIVEKIVFSKLKRRDLFFFNKNDIFSKFPERCIMMCIKIGQNINLALSLRTGETEKVKKDLEVYCAKGAEIQLKIESFTVTKGEI
jgi:hypothetical protein